MKTHAQAPPVLPLRTGRIVRHDEHRHALYDPASGQLHILNDTALAVWELCDGATTPEEMADGIAVVFRATPPQIAHDIRNTLNNLAEAGLIVWAGPNDPPDRPDHGEDAAT